MDILAISLAALAASTLTFFSGFGLGTLLMPVVALFLPVEIAIAVTAVVHLANNLLKVALLGQQANGPILLRFGLPAALASFAGALALGALAGMEPLLEYTLAQHTLEIQPIKLIVGLLILGFVILELSSWFNTLVLDPKFLPLGGAISGFFGGLSGHQGAFRGMFLLKAGMAKEEFIATSVMLAVLVDVARMSVYGLEIHRDINWSLAVAGSLAAFAGTFFSARMLKKLTIKAVQGVVSGLLILIALGLITGLL